MSGYIIVNEHGAFHCDPQTTRGGHCWTRSIGQAKRFATREDAERGLCPENEHVEPMDRYLQPLR